MQHRHNRIRWTIGLLIAFSSVILIVHHSFQEDGGSKEPKHGVVDTPGSKTPQDDSVVASEAAARAFPPEPATSMGTDVADSGGIQNHDDDSVRQEIENADLSEEKLAQVTDIDRYIEERMAYFTDTAIPLQEREAEVWRFARQGNDVAVRVLTALAESNVYLSTEAVRALGTITSPAAKHFLALALDDVNTPNVTYLFECIRSAAKVLDDPVKEIGETLVAARDRPDGHAAAIREVCVDALGSTRQMGAIPVLQTELDYMCAQDELDLAHGSAIVKAYEQISDKRACPILIQYSDVLERRMPEEPMPKAYYQDKIDEARKTTQRILANG